MEVERKKKTPLGLVHKVGVRKQPPLERGTEE